MILLNAEIYYVCVYWLSGIEFALYFKKSLYNIKSKRNETHRWSEKELL